MNLYNIIIIFDKKKNLLLPITKIFMYYEKIIIYTKIFLYLLKSINKDTILLSYVR